MLLLLLLVALPLGASEAAHEQGQEQRQPHSRPAQTNIPDQIFGAHWQAKLCTKAATPTTPAQPYIELRFTGPISEFAGPLCYHFAGYNETCLPPQKRWLTPATSIELIAPGQVPPELLQGYILLVRFPWQSDLIYRYPLSDQSC